MNRQQFISYVQQPAVLSADSVVLLDGLLKEYPFFQTAQLLYAKNLFDQNSIQYNHQLKVAAAYSGDRRVLYKLINDKAVQQEPAGAKMVIVQPVSESLVKPVIQVDLKQQKLIENIELKVEKLLDAKFEKLSSKLEETTKVIEQRLHDVEQQSAEVIPVEKAEVKSDIAEIKPPKDIQLVYSIGKKFEPESKTPVDAGEMSDLTKNAINEAIDASVEMQVSHLIYDEKKKKQQVKKVEDAKAEEQKGLDKNAVLSFTKWLKNTKRFEAEKQVGRQQVLDLIDKFVDNEESKISKPKAEFFSPEHMARKSMELDENMITETLAKILVKQKNYSKAIRAYETLSLKYPEKSVFFATQIIEIRKLIKST